MPSNDVKPTKMQPVFIALGVLLSAGLIALKVGGYFQRPQPAPVVSAVRIAPTTNNVVVTSKPVAPGTAISAESVLDSVDKWLAQHPTYHAYIETSLPSGTVMSKMDVYAYVDGTNGQIARMKSVMFLPQQIEYRMQKQNGKLEAYFPNTDQLVEEDVSKLLLSMPVLAANGSSVKGLLKLARSSFAEASADLRVVTVVVNAAALQLKDTSGDFYLSLRSDDEGKPLGVEEQAWGQRAICKIKYLSFDRDAVAFNAPAMPAGKVVNANKTLQQAMKEEILQAVNKRLGMKI
jgi:hypothetical protein